MSDALLCDGCWTVAAPESARGARWIKVALLADSVEDVPLTHPLRRTKHLCSLECLAAFAQGTGTQDPVDFAIPEFVQVPVGVSPVGRNTAPTSEPLLAPAGVSNLNSSSRENVRPVSGSSRRNRKAAPVVADVRPAGEVTDVADNEVQPPPERTGPRLSEMLAGRDGPTIDLQKIAAESVKPARGLRRRRP